MVQRGAWDLDIGRDFQFFDFGAPFARATESSLKSIGASRHLIQTTLQDEALARNAGKLQVMEGRRVSSLVWSADGGTVLGVELSDGERVEADLVIVALGRYCRLPQWLEAAGYEAPPTQRVDCGLRYSSRLYQMPEGWAANGMGLWGINGVTPPTDEDGFLEFAASLPDQSIYQSIRSAKPLTPIHKYAGAFNIRREYNKVQLPRGLVVLGDAYVALNPVYAQGMSVAAVSALTLGQELAAALAAADSKPGNGKAGESSSSLEARRVTVQGMGPAFQKRLAGVVEAPWSIATSEDMRYPGTKVEGVAAPPRLLGLYVDSLLRACHRDSQVQDIFFSVAHLTRPPHHLFHPHLLAAAAGQLLRDLKQRWWPAAAATAAPGGAAAVEPEAADAARAKAA
ncbi:2-polyprenyl-6-methoxyphenol hydroxylase-like oxidoreductase [Chlorella sorokiniana]|uniref:2-polyprenyl-6-methoxyphenol hydroxylase-like oxidoreductase n=1 Tax=Chlorella sorokiniana TaxID=3076 RepID=A0A2P6TJY1_CHLSO|nr:2-polyprenyl-6-methoxyphenol hydroxylase-like oxidoreductase [Chlorella sorokiniana]|eukprot:PRW44383.1 2-polyprenyl-6-methoxyphenol hydroxylase-like oxidoreductase [Chlorella sorokiniana]